jgi:hypothetical protein
MLFILMSMLCSKTSNTVGDWLCVLKRNPGPNGKDEMKRAHGTHTLCWKQTLSFLDGRSTGDLRPNGTWSPQRTAYNVANPKKCHEMAWELTGGFGCRLSRSSDDTWISDVGRSWTKFPRSFDQVLWATFEVCRDIESLPIWFVEWGLKSDHQVANATESRGNIIQVHT